jgi:hypothetical protein
MEIKSISAPSELPEKDARAKWRGPRSTVAFLAVVIATVGMGFYAGTVLNPTELVHFSVPVPAGHIDRPRMVGQAGGRRSFIKPIKVDVSEQGSPKRLFCPWIVGLSTHWISNIGSKPHRIGMRLENTTFPVEWHVNASIPWDPQSGTFARALEPGERVPELAIDWMFNIPVEVRNKPIWYEGGLSVFDADSREVLTFIPISFVNSGATHEDSGVCDHCSP